MQSCLVNILLDAALDADPDLHLLDTVFIGLHILQKGIVYQHHDSQNRNQQADFSRETKLQTGSLVFEFRQRNSGTLHALCHLSHLLLVVVSRHTLPEVKYIDHIKYHKHNRWYKKSKMIQLIDSTPCNLYMDRVPEI